MGRIRERLSGQDLNGKQVISLLLLTNMHKKAAKIDFAAFFVIVLSLMVW